MPYCPTKGAWTPHPAREGSGAEVHARAALSMCFGLSQAVPGSSGRLVFCSELCLPHALSVRKSASCLERCRGWGQQATG